MDKFQNNYRIATNRLSGFDYGSNAFYFVTICTKNREHYFGEIITNRVEPHHNVASLINKQRRNNSINKPHNGTCKMTHKVASLRMTEIGKIVQQYWTDIPNHYPFVVLDEFVLMPNNHVHVILYLNPINKTDLTLNKFGPQSNNLGAIIRAYKSSVKRYANQNDIEFEWQLRYHDRIIKDENEYFSVEITLLIILIIGGWISYTTLS